MATNIQHIAASKRKTSKYFVASRMRRLRRFFVAAGVSLIAWAAVPGMSSAAYVTYFNGYTNQYEVKYSNWYTSTGGEISLTPFATGHICGEDYYTHGVICEAGPGWSTRVYYSSGTRKNSCWWHSDLGGGTNAVDCLKRTP